MKIHRLKNRADFVRLTHVGRKYVMPSFIVQVSPNALGHWRVGLTASKKVGNAVERNRAKRLLRAVVDETMRLNPEFNMPAQDMVIVARKSILSKPYNELLGDFNKMLKQCAGA